MIIERVQNAAYSLKFGKKSLKHDKHKGWLQLNKNKRITRLEKPKLCSVVSRPRRFQTSPISYLTELLNKYFAKGK